MLLPFSLYVPYRYRHWGQKSLDPDMETFDIVRSSLFFCHVNNAAAIRLFKTVQHFPMELNFIQPVLGQKLRPAGIGAYAALFVIGAYNY